MFQPDVIDGSEILPQGRIGGWVSPQNGGAEIRTRLAKETELSLLVATPAKPVSAKSVSTKPVSTKPVDLRGSSEHAQPVGIIKRYRKTQDGEVPRPDHPGVPFIWPFAQFLVAREAGNALVNN
jgi:hypothetical protein